MSYCYDYPRPAVTVDIALFAPRDGKLSVLLIRRQAEPFEDHWALPGGFVDQHEDLADAARRELLEETGLTAPKLLELGAYGKPGRDPRGHTVSIVYLGLFGAAPPTPAAGDDAADARWRPARRPPKLAFDHRQILADARARLRALAAEPELLTRQLLRRRPPPEKLQSLQNLIRSS